MILLTASSGPLPGCPSPALGSVGEVQVRQQSTLISGRAGGQVRDRGLLSMSKTQDLTSQAENISKKIFEEERVSKIPYIIFKYLVAFKYHLFIYFII